MLVNLSQYLIQIIAMEKFQKFLSSFTSPSKREQEQDVEKALLAQQLVERNRLLQEFIELRQEIDEYKRSLGSPLTTSYTSESTLAGGKIDGASAKEKEPEKVSSKSKKSKKTLAPTKGELSYVERVRLATLRKSYVIDTVKTLLAELGGRHGNGESPTSEGEVIDKDLDVNSNLSKVAEKKFVATTTDVKSNIPKVAEKKSVATTTVKNDGELSGVVQGSASLASSVEVTKLDQVPANFGDSRSPRKGSLRERRMERAAGEDWAPTAITREKSGAEHNFGESRGPLKGILRERRIERADGEDWAPTAITREKSEADLIISEMVVDRRGNGPLPKSNFGEARGPTKGVLRENSRVDGEGDGAPEALTLVRVGGEGVRAPQALTGVEGEGVGAPKALTLVSQKGRNFEANLIISSGGNSGMSKSEPSEKFSETGPGIPSSSILNGDGLLPGIVAPVAPKKKNLLDKRAVTLEETPGGPGISEIPHLESSELFSKFRKFPKYQAATERIWMKATKVQHPPLDFHSGTDPPEFISKNYPITGVVFPSQSGRYGSSRGSCRE